MRKLLLLTAAAVTLSAAASPLAITNRVYKAQQQPGVLLSEDFEGYQSSTDWLPEGWSIECKGDKHADGDYASNWHVQPRTSFALPMPSSGMHYACCFYQSSSTARSDEWLYTPELNLTEGNFLSFYLWLDPGTMFNVSGDPTLDDVNNFDVTATFQVWVLPSDGEAVMLEDVADRFKGMTFREMYAEATNDLEKHTYDLSAYTGKKVKIGFRYVGSDGNIFFLDDVRVSLADAVAEYTTPRSTLYAGYSLYNEMWDRLPQDCAVFPAYSDLTFETGENEGHTYAWEYQMPGFNSRFENATGNSLTLAMLPDFTNEATTANSLYAMPSLTASADNRLDAQYMHPARVMMAGGNPSRHLLDETTNEDFYLNYGLLPFPVGRDGIDIYVEEPMDIQEPSVPIFGYSNRTRQWWTNHYFEGEAAEGDYAEVKGFLNIYYATEQPIVIDRIWVLAKGQVSPGIRLKAQIRALNKKYEDNGDVLAECYCSYEDILQAEGGQQSFLTLVFNLPEPLAISTADCPYYIVEISGFTDGGVTWLAPMQSYKRDIQGLCHGFLNVDVNYEGTLRNLMAPIGNFQNEFKEDMYNSFVINLGATFPYLRAAEENAEVPELSDDNTVVTVPLLSWYPGEKLTVDVPDGFEAAVEGRWNNAKLKITALKDGPAGSFTAKVKCPGIELDVPFKSKGVTVALDEIAANGTREVKAIYTADGRNAGTLSVDDLTSGIYIVSYTDGSVAKISR